MPFWDDVNLLDLPDLVGRMLLIDVFDWPERFRFNIVGQALVSEEVAGKFIDEMDLGTPFEFLRSQCSATVEAAAPTFFHQVAAHQSLAARAYSRLLLPMWGEGRIGMLLGVVDFK
jgi:hypothetical protein